MDKQIADAFDLTGRVAVVTGAAGGIGRQTALTLAGAGARVVIGDIPGSRLAETEEALRAQGAEVRTVEIDVQNAADVDALASAALDSFGRLDVWANIAAILRHTPFLEVTEAELDEIIAVNLKGVFFGCQAAGRAMAAAGRGSIINIASQGMDMPTAGISVYSLTKAAVAMLTRTVATELGPNGVRVNSIAPGFIETPMVAYRWTDADGSVDAERRVKAIDEVARLNPLHAAGEPLDIALAILYLAADASKYMTGQVLRPNGGGSMV